MKQLRRHNNRYTLPLFAYIISHSSLFSLLDLSSPFSLLLFRFIQVITTIFMCTYGPIYLEKSKDFTKHKHLCTGSKTKEVHCEIYLMIFSSLLTSFLHHIIYHSKHFLKMILNESFCQWYWCRIAWTTDTEVSLPLMAWIYTSISNI